MWNFTCSAVLVLYLIVFPEFKLVSCFSLLPEYNNFVECIGRVQVSGYVLIRSVIWGPKHPISFQFLLDWKCFYGHSIKLESGGCRPLTAVFLATIAITSLVPMDFTSNGASTVFRTVNPIRKLFWNLFDLNYKLTWVQGSVSSTQRYHQIDKALHLSKKVGAFSAAQFSNSYFVLPNIYEKKYFRTNIQLS